MYSQDTLRLLFYGNLQLVIRSLDATEDEFIEMFKETFINRLFI
ncbi:hypothetical protein [Gottschalkia acidurici]|nr:hypothetical protein [Gottschalkia acidurici]